MPFLLRDTRAHPSGLLNQSCVRVRKFSLNISVKAAKSELNYEFEFGSGVILIRLESRGE